MTLFDDVVIGVGVGFTGGLTVWVVQAAVKAYGDTRVYGERIGNMERDLDAVRTSLSAISDEMKSLVPLVRKPPPPAGGGHP